MSSSDTFDFDMAELNELTIAEIVEIEDRAGVSLDQFMSADVPKGRMLQVLAFIMRRRQDPEFTWEDAGNLKIDFSGSSNGEVPEVDPTDASDS